jgi:hypothetical protein
LPAYYFGRDSKVGERMNITPNKSNANLFGEYLRREFFKEESCGSIGWEPKDCVNVETFEHQGHDGQITIFSATKEIGGEVIAAEWLWDNDWHLTFEFSCGEIVSNYDAKKDYGWEFASSILGLAKT